LILPVGLIFGLVKSGSSGAGCSGFSGGFVLLIGVGVSLVNCWRDFRTNDMENYTLEVGRAKYYSGLRIVFDGRKRKKFDEWTDKGLCRLLLPEQQARVLANSILTFLDNPSVSIEKTTIDETKNEKI